MQLKDLELYEQFLQNFSFVIIENANQEVARIMH